MRYACDMREKNIQALVSYAEHRALTEAAKREGLPLASWMRRVLLQAARDAEEPKELT